MTGICHTLVLSQKAAHSAASPAIDHVQQGRLLARQNKWAEAEREFRIAHQQQPASADAQVGHAEALVKIGQPFDAALELQSFLHDHPNSARAHELYAVVALAIKDDFLVAEKEMEQVVKLAPDNGMAWKSLGDIYVDHATPKEAIEAYKKASRLLPRDASIVAALADAYAQAEDSQEARDTFARAVKMSEDAPDSPEARRNKAGVQYLYGRYLLDQGRPQESIAAITRALAYNPHSTVALYLRARGYEAVGDYKRAEADALQGLDFAAHDKQGPLLLIDIYRKLHDVENVRKYAEMAQRLVDEEQDRSSFARDVRRLLGVAEAALREGRFRDAIPPYEDLIEKVPTFYEAYLGIGTCYAQTGRLADAETAFRKYLSFQKISGDGHAMLGVLLLQLERGQEASAELELALQIDPSLDEARKALATEYVRESRPEEAIRTLRAAKTTKDPELIVMLAGILMQKGDTASAQRQVNRALALRPDDPDALKLKREILQREQVGK
jgi:tetratricopeptide (TPR) repeat protein